MERSVEILSLSLSRKKTMILSDVLSRFSPRFGDFSGDLLGPGPEQFTEGVT